MKGFEIIKRGKKGKAGKKNVWLRLLTYLKPHLTGIVFVLIFAVASTLFTIMAPYVIGKVTTTLYASLKTGSFNWKEIYKLVIEIASIYLISNLFSFLQGFIMAKITANVMKEVRRDINAKMHRLKLNYYDGTTHGNILSVITNDVDMLNNVISHTLISIFIQVITAVGIVFTMISISPKLSIIPLVVVPFALLCASGLMKACQKYFRKRQATLGSLNGYIEEIFNGLQVVHCFNYQEKAKSEFSRLNEELKVSARKAQVTSGAVSPITTFINDLGYILIAAIGCSQAIRGTILVGNVQAMLTYSQRFSSPFSAIAGMAGIFGAASAAANRIFTLLDAEEEVPDAKDALVPQDRKGNVRFEDINFSYTADRVIIHDLSLEAKSGQRVAIVGPTGAGKTTLVNLLMRFYEVDKGAIYVDGVNIRDMKRSELRSRLGMVLQDTWLFEGTIAENIAYAGENVSREKIIDSAKYACADDFIKTLPGGYDMVLSKGAENISQGERQLLTIARAIAADPEIMILDEATSNVDTHTEVLIQKAMTRIMQGHTCFVIAHRLSTIRDADIILYMEDGDIKEVGTHQELLKKNGKYAALYNSQFD